LRCGYVKDSFRSSRFANSALSHKSGLKLGLRCGNLAVTVVIVPVSVSSKGGSLVISDRFGALNKLMVYLNPHVSLR